MRSIPLMMTIIGIAFSLVILGLYLYQTAPDNNTTNLPESASIVLPAVSSDSDSSGNKPDDATDTDDSSAPSVEESSSTDPARLILPLMLPLILNLVMQFHFQ
jgi:hypothetical protein